MGHTEFKRALARALEGKNHADIAEASGVAASTISTWLRSSGRADPGRVFAVEKALDLPPGHLSHHLGYLPVTKGDSPPDIRAAIDADPTLDEIDKDVMRALYSALRTRWPASQTISPATRSERTKDRSSSSRSSRSAT